MNMKETAAIMSQIKLDDNRNLGGNEEERLIYLRDWFTKIGDLDFQDAWDAVAAHTRDSTEYLKAAHIRAGVRKIQAQRDRQQRIDGQISRAAQRAITGNTITLDIVQHNKETAEFIEHYRSLKAGGA